jgi:hypothetical protein
VGVLGGIPPFARRPSFHRPKTKRCETRAPIETKQDERKRGKTQAAAAAAWIR